MTHLHHSNHTHEPAPDVTAACRHYDWGLRAIKSVLVVAGSLLRAQEGQVESDVLFRALRDFNIPKILSQDMVIFTGLLQDLFPAVDPPRKRDMDFEKVSVLCGCLPGSKALSLAHMVRGSCSSLAALPRT